jgi:hypothetical protein
MDGAIFTMKKTPFLKKFGETGHGQAEQRRWRADLAAHRIAQAVRRPQLSTPRSVRLLDAAPPLF